MFLKESPQQNLKECNYEEMRRKKTLHQKNKKTKKQKVKEVLISSFCEEEDYTEDDFSIMTAVRFNTSEEALNFPDERKIPEKELLRGILRRSIMDLQIPFDSRDKHSACKWVLSDSEEPFSFIWILEQIDAECFYSPVRKMAYQARLDHGW